MNMKLFFMQEEYLFSEDDLTKSKKSKNTKKLIKQWIGQWNYTNDHTLKIIWYIAEICKYLIPETQKLINIFRKNKCVSDDKSVVNNNHKYLWYIFKNGHIRCKMS